MAEDDDDFFSFGDFKSALPLPSQPHSNGVTFKSKNDDVWADFFSSPSPSPSQSKFNNGFGPSPVLADPNPNKFQKHNGTLPLFLFGELEENNDESNRNNVSYGLFDSKPRDQNRNFVAPKNDDVIKSEIGFSFNFNGQTPDLIVNNGNNSVEKIKEEDDYDDDEWEFTSAFSGNGVVADGNLKEQGNSVEIGSKLESLAVMDQEKQTGQNASNSVETKPSSINFFPQSTDFFAASYENGNSQQFSEVDAGLKATMSTSNGFMWDPFPKVEDIGEAGGANASSINDDDFDDFGDFVDASHEAVSKKEEPVVTQLTPTNAQLLHEEVQEKQTAHSRGALPLSLFSDDPEESNDCLDLQNEVVHKPSLSSGYSFNTQSSGIPIHDLISNLYSQAQLTTSVDSTRKADENGVHFPSTVSVTTPLDGDDIGDDGSWEYIDALSENGVKEQLPTAIPGNMSQKQSEILPELQTYIDFYEQLRDSLCFLLSCQLDELKKARSSDAVSDYGGTEDPHDAEIQEAVKLLESSGISEEVLLKNDLERKNCLSNYLEVLREPKFNVIEANFSLSKKLQLATNELRVAVELLRHALSMLKILSLGSAYEQSIYVSTWSKIINVCLQELSYGASIWKRASEKNIKHQILSDSQGQRYFQALGEIYKVVELLGLSAKVFKPWILLTLSNSAQFFGVLDECKALWSNSGLKEAVQNLSDHVDFGCSENAKALLSSIKNILDIDIITVHDHIFIQHNSHCRMSMLPEDMLEDLKTVMWGEKTYFLNLANLWANLISRDPPQLPLLQVS